MRSSDTGTYVVRLPCHRKRQYKPHIEKGRLYLPAQRAPVRGLVAAICWRQFCWRRYKFRNAAFAGYPQRSRLHERAKLYAEAYYA